MGIFREIPPTAGFSLYLQDILSYNKAGSLEDDFKDYLGVSYANVTYSGTAAFYLILEALKKISAKTTVVIPAYICPLVPLAISRAGLKVEVCDINKYDFEFEAENLNRICDTNSDILAVVAVHLGGIPVDLNRLQEIAQKHGIFIIEDCAQSLGAQYKGKNVGALGDFSFFSLCRGKGLTIYEGGVLAAKRNEYAAKIEEVKIKLVKEDFISETFKILELFGYWIFYRPLLFWYVYSLPQLFWNLSGNSLRAVSEYYSADFPIHKVSHFRKSIGHVSFEKLQGEISEQRQKAYFYLEELEGAKGVRAIREAPGTKATYPYVVLVFEEPEKQGKALTKLKTLGLGISKVYACAVTDYDYLKGIIPQASCPNAQFMARREITLSTSKFIKKEEQEIILKVIKNLS